MGLNTDFWSEDPKWLYISDLLICEQLNDWNSLIDSKKFVIFHLIVSPSPQTKTDKAVMCNK